MRTFLIGLWSVVIALGTTCAIAFVSLPPKPGSPAETKQQLQVQKTRVINVPMISGGAIRGYIVAQFAYTVDAEQAKNLTVSPDAFLLDEAFRTIYTDDHLDFLHLDKYDINGLTHRLLAATNTRLGVNLVHDVLIQDFTFISKEENER